MNTVTGAGKRTRYECGICWQVYNPAEGDLVAQIPPGVAFEDLPETWCCSNCEAPRLKFMRLGDDG